MYCLAENVPSTQSNAFEDSYIEYSTLHVPAESISAYKEKEPWKNFKETVTLDGSLPGDPETPKCATPTIIFANGELEFSCETEGVEYVSEVTISDAKKNYTNKVSLTGVYKVSVYAMKTGYENSDVATAEIKLSSAGGLKGDVNNDGVVDIADAVKIVNMVVGKVETLSRKSLEVR